MKDYPHSLTVKKSIIDFWKKYTDTEINYDNIVLCDGSIGALFLINKLFIEITTKQLYMTKRLIQDRYIEVI